jgi:catechol 2,3-dioxygenase-like lactoylglutathione lyase family enzyme
VAERDPLSDFLCEHAGMHVIDKTDTFTLVGADARRGKLTLFEAEGPRERGTLVHVAIKVREIPGGVAGEERDGIVLVDAPEGLRLGFVHTDEGEEFDLDHVRLRVPDPQQALGELSLLGFERENGTLRAGDKRVVIEQGDAEEGDSPLLNHLALLVDSVKEHIDEAERRGLDIEDVVDAANTIALFVRGPAGIRIEYVEHKPGFSLA